MSFLVLVLLQRELFSFAKSLFWYMNLYGHNIEQFRLFYPSIYSCNGYASLKCVGVSIGHFASEILSECLFCVCVRLSV